MLSQKIVFGVARILYLLKRNPVEFEFPQHLSIILQILLEEFAIEILLLLIQVEGPDYLVPWLTSEVGILKHCLNMWWQSLHIQSSVSIKIHARDLLSFLLEVPPQDVGDVHKEWSKEGQDIIFSFFGT